MSLQFIFGNSGSGKSEYGFRYIIEKAMRHPEQYKENATSIFPNTIIGKDHMHFDLNFDQDFAEPTIIETRVEGEDDE